MKSFAGKKILLLGGSKPYVKVARRAKQLGIYVIVVDQRATKEILQYTDNYIQTSLLNIEKLERWCEDNPVDGIINFCVDFAQRTYQVLCSSFNLPCFYSKEQVDTLANKKTFKELLFNCGLETITSYSEQDVIEDRVRFPIIVKPSEGSGSRGNTTCFCKDEAVEAIKNAKAESRNTDIIIEEYIQGAQEIQITYFLSNKDVHVLRTADSYQGKKEDQLDRVVVCAISPSRYTNIYFEESHESVLKMVNSLGLHDGPFFMQGFFHEGKFKFFDPGCRFPGVDFDVVYETLFGIDIAEMMIYYSLTGSMPEVEIPSDIYNLNGKMGAVLFPVMNAGRITKVAGADLLNQNNKIFSSSSRHNKGDEISFTHDVNQRYGEFDIIGDDIHDLKNVILAIQRQLQVFDNMGNNMIYSDFDVNRIITSINVKG